MRHRALGQSWLEAPSPSHTFSIVTGSPTSLSHPVVPIYHIGPRNKHDTGITYFVNKATASYHLQLPLGKSNTVFIQQRVGQATHKRWQRMARSFCGNMGYFWGTLAAFWLSQQEFSMGHVSRAGPLTTPGPEGWITEAPSHSSGRGNLNHALQSTNACKYLCKIRSVSSLAIFQRAEQGQKTNYIYCLRKRKLGNLAMCLC